MKIALVHDYVKEFGGAERVLEVLCEMFPNAPIYTAFYQDGSAAYEKFKKRKIITSWAHRIPFFATKLHSPLRFLAPLIWSCFDFSQYDVVITSASWYITKGVINGKWPHFSKASGGKQTEDGKLPIEICYCHTPPRWLYGYQTSVEWQRYWPIKIYGSIVGHFMRQYDFDSAQKVDYFIANSEETRSRIKKFYRRDAKVIYPPVELPISDLQSPILKFKSPISNLKRDYYFIVSRLVGGKGLDLAIEAANQLGIKLKIAGAASGYSSVASDLSKRANGNIEFLGKVTDAELVELYTNAKAFLALATDEDFGMTLVESMLCGTPVIAYYGGGYKETVVEGKTGLFFKESTVECLVEAIKKFEKMKLNSEDCKKRAEMFGKARFTREIRGIIREIWSPST